MLHRRLLGVTGRLSTGLGGNFPVTGRVSSSLGGNFGVTRRLPSGLELRFTSAGDMEETVREQVRSFVNDAGGKDADKDR